MTRAIATEGTVATTAARGGGDTYSRIGTSPKPATMRTPCLTSRQTRPISFCLSREWESADALHPARAQQYFQESTRRSVEDLEVTAHPAIYRVVVEVVAD